MLALPKKFPQLAIVVIAAALFLPGLGAVHLFDWDELNFAEIAREMTVSGDWSRPTIGFEPFNEKPPLFMWLQAGCMSLLGANEFAARLPDALCGIVTLLILFRLGRRLHGEGFGWSWVLAWCGSLLPQLYFHSGIIDPWFNLFIFLGLVAFIRAIEERSRRQAAFSGAWLGLAVLTKGPVGLLIPALVIGIGWARGRARPLLPWKHLLLSAIAFVATSGCWVLYDLLRHGPEFMIAFFWRQLALLTTEDAGHGGFIGYHVVVLLLGCFPASLFAVQEMAHPSDDKSAWRRWMSLLFWVVLVLFSLVKTKIVHYSSLCYFPITYLAALRIASITGRNRAFGWSRFAVGILGTLIAIVVIALPFVMMRRDLIEPLFEKDPFALASLRAEVAWAWHPMLAGVWLLAVLGTAQLLHQRRAHAASVIALFCGTTLFVPITLYFYIGRIEAHSQRAAIEFFQLHASEKCWLMTKGYHSYAPEFYGRVTGVRPSSAALCTGPVDRPVFLSCKITDVTEVKELGTFHEVGRKNGFVFWKRDP